MTTVRRRSGLKGSNLDADSSNNLFTRSEQSNTYVWDSGTLAWIRWDGGSGGGGGAVTIANGADVTQGAKADVAWVAGDGTVISLLKTIASGGGGGSGPVTIIDGGNVVEGALADAAIITDTTGTINGKLRGLVKHAFERMPAALGQAAMAASLPVVIASNQTSFPVTIAAGAAVIGHVIVDSGTVTTVSTVTAVTTLGTITNVVHVDDNAGSLTVDGTVALAAGAAVIGHVIVDSGTITAVTAITNALPAGANVIGHVIADTGSTTAVTGNVTVIQGTGTNLHAVTDTGSTTAATQATAANLKTLVDINAAQTLATVTTVGTVTTITNVVHVDDNASSLTVDAPVGTPLFARLSDGAAALIGQKAMTASLPVVLASDQASVPVAATLTAETVKVIGTVNQGTSPWVVSGAVTLASTTITGTVAVSNTGLTDLDSAIGTPDLTTIPSMAILIGGKTNDIVPLFEPLPLNLSGKAVIVDTSGDPSTNDLLNQMVAQLSALNTVTRRMAVEQGCDLPDEFDDLFADATATGG